MKQEIKEKWTAALRSGTYRQATGGLKKNDGYCCLGVLCDIIDPNAWEEASVSYWVDPISNVKLHSNLGEDQLISVGMTYGYQSELISMNDDQEKTFSEIADWIEKNL